MILRRDCAISELVEKFLKISSRVELSEWLGISDRRLRFILYGLKSSDRYRSFEVPKRNGGVRQIQAPTKALLSIQKAVHEAISIIVKPSAIAHGYVRGKTIVDNAKPHRARRWVVAIDLADYFPSINFGRVRGAFLSAPFRFPPEVATCLAQICCLDDRLPGLPRLN